VRALAPGKSALQSVRLFAPKPAYRYADGGGGGRPPAGAGANPPNGVVVFYSLGNGAAPAIKLRFFDVSGKLVKEFSSTTGAETAAPTVEGEERAPAVKLPTQAGLNRFVWDMRYGDATGFPGLILWASNLRGPLVVPGTYTVELEANGRTERQQFEIKKDPRASTTQDDFSKQLALELQIRDEVSAADRAVMAIRSERHQLSSYTSGDPVVVSEADRISAALSSVENSLYQTKLESTKDPLNYPVKLNNKLTSLLATVSTSDAHPTAQSYEVFEQLSSQLEEQLGRLQQINAHDIGGLNSLLRERHLATITFGGTQ
jgi:hypothetical protein